MASIFKDKEEALKEVRSLQSDLSNLRSDDPITKINAVSNLRNRIPTSTKLGRRVAEDFDITGGRSSKPVQQTSQPVEQEAEQTQPVSTGGRKVVDDFDITGGRSQPTIEPTAEPIVDEQPVQEEGQPVEGERTEGFVDSVLSLGTAFKEGFQTTMSRSESGIDVLTDNKESILEEEAFTRDLQKNSELVEKKLFLNEVYKNKDSDGFIDAIRDVAGAIIEEPFGATQFAVEQSPTSLGALGSGLVLGKAGAVVGSVVPVVGTTVGAVTGFLLGMFGFNALQEVGGKAQEKASDGDFTDEERGEALKEGTIKAGVITGVDALTLGASRYTLGLKNTVVEKATINALEKQGINSKELLKEIGNSVDLAKKIAVRAKKNNSDLISVQNTLIGTMDKTARKFNLDRASVRQSVIDAQKKATQSLEYVTKKYGGYKMALALETLGEGLGEYLGELIATGEASEIDAVLESVAGLSQSIATIAVKTPLDPVIRKVTGQQARPDSLGGEVTSEFDRLKANQEFKEIEKVAEQLDAERQAEEETRDRFQFQYIQNILNEENAVEVLAGMHFDAGEDTKKGKTRRETIQDVAQRNGLAEELNKIINSEDKDADNIRKEVKSLIADKGFKDKFYQILDSYGGRGETPFFDRNTRTTTKETKPTEPAFTNVVDSTGSVDLTEIEKEYDSYQAQVQKDPTVIAKGFLAKGNKPLSIEEYTLRKQLQTKAQDYTKQNGYYSTEREINRVKKNQQARKKTLNLNETEFKTLADERGLTVDEYRNLIKDNYRTNTKRLFFLEEEFKKLTKPKKSKIKFKEVVDEEVKQARDSQMDDANAMIADAVAEDRAEEEASLPPVRKRKFQSRQYKVGETAPPIEVEDTSETREIRSIAESKSIKDDDDDFRASRVPSRQIKVPRDARFKDLDTREGTVTTEPIQKEKAPFQPDLNLQQIDADLPTNITVDDSGTLKQDRPLGNLNKLKRTLTSFYGSEAEVTPIYKDKKFTGKYRVTVEDEVGEVTTKVIDTSKIKPITRSEQIKEIRRIAQEQKKSTLQRGDIEKKNLRDQLREAENSIYLKKVMKLLGLNISESIPSERFERLDRAIMAPERPFNQQLKQFEDTISEEERKLLPKKIVLSVDNDGFIDNIFFAERKVPSFRLSRNPNVSDDIYRKDLRKKQVATKFIGRGVKGSSTELYRQDYANFGLANTGQYTSVDVVFVSSNGKRPNAMPPQWAEIKKAVGANATIVLDSSDSVSEFSVGDRKVARYLTESGYVERKVQGKNFSYFTPRLDENGNFVTLDPINESFAKIMERYVSLDIPSRIVAKKYTQIQNILKRVGYTTRQIDMLLGENGANVEKLYQDLIPKNKRNEPNQPLYKLLSDKNFNINKTIEYILTKTPLVDRIEEKSEEQIYMENEIAERQRDAQLDQKIRVAKSNEAFAEIRKQVKGLGLVDRQVDKLISKGRTKPVSFKKKDIELGDLVKYRNKNFLTEDANDILRSLIGAKRVGEREEKNNYQAKYQLTGNNIYGLSLEQRQKILKNINTPDGVALDLYIIEENRRRKRAKLKRLKKQEVINNISNQPYFSAKRTSAIYQIIINNKIRKILTEDRPVRIQFAYGKSNRETNDDLTLTVQEMKDALDIYAKNLDSFVKKVYNKQRREEQQAKIADQIKFSTAQFKAFERAFERLRSGYNERLYGGQSSEKVGTKYKVPYKNPFIEEVEKLRKKYTVTPEGVLIRKDFVNKHTQKLKDIFGTYDKRLEFFSPVINKIDSMIDDGVGDPSAKQDIEAYNELIAELEEARDNFENEDYSPTAYQEYQKEIQSIISSKKKKIPYIPFDNGQYISPSEELNMDISTGRMKDEVPPEQFTASLNRAINQLSEEIEFVKQRRLEGNASQFVRNFVLLKGDVKRNAQQAVRELINSTTYLEQTADIEAFQKYVRDKIESIYLTYVEHLGRKEKVKGNMTSPTLDEDSVNLRTANPIEEINPETGEITEGFQKAPEDNKAYVRLDQMLDRQAEATLEGALKLEKGLTGRQNIGDTEFAILEKVRELMDTTNMNLADIRKLYNIKRIDLPVTNAMLLSYLPMRKKLSTHLKDQKIGYRATDEYFNAVFNLEKMLLKALDGADYTWYGKSQLNLKPDLNNKTSFYSKIFENDQQLKDYLQWKTESRRLVSRSYRMQDIKSIQEELQTREKGVPNLNDFLFKQFSLDRIRSLKENLNLKEKFMLEKYGNLTVEQLEDAWHQDVEFVRKKYPETKLLFQNGELISEEDYFEHRAWHKKRLQNMVTSKNVQRVERLNYASFEEAQEKKVQEFSKKLGQETKKKITPIRELVNQGVIDTQQKLKEVAQDLFDYVKLLDSHTFDYDVIARDLEGNGKFEFIPIKDLSKYPQVTIRKVEQEIYDKGQKTSAKIAKAKESIGKKYGKKFAQKLEDMVRQGEYVGTALARTVINREGDIAEDQNEYHVSKVLENQEIEDISNNVELVAPPEEEGYLDSLINDDTGRTRMMSLDDYDNPTEDGVYPDDDNDYRASRVSTGGKSGVSSGANVKRWINDVTKKWKIKPKIHVVNDIRYLPAPLRRRLLKKFGENAHLKGLYDNRSGAIYLFSDHLVDRDDVEFTFFHEVVGHLGMRGFLGENFTKVLQNLYNTNLTVRSLADEKSKDFGIGRLEAIEEALADLAGKGEQLTAVRRIIKFFTNGLRNLGMNSVADYVDKLTTDEIGLLLEKSFEFARNGGVKTFDGSPDAVRTNRNPVELFARITIKKDNKTQDVLNGYATYSHITNTWTVFFNPAMTGLANVDYPVQQMVNTYEEAIELLENAMGGKSKVRITSRYTRPFYEGGRQPNEFSNIYDRTANEHNTFKRWMQNVWQWTQNEYLPVFLAVKHATNVNDSNDLRIFLQNYERRVADALRDFKDSTVSELYNLVEQARAKGVDEDILNDYLVATASEERNIQTLRNNNVPDEVIKEYIKILKEGKITVYNDVKKALIKKFPQHRSVIEPKNLAGSGMFKYANENVRTGDFTKGYQAIIQEVERSKYAKELKAIAKILDEMGNSKVKLMHNAGLITLADMSKRLKAYSHYRTMAGQTLDPTVEDEDQMSQFKALSGGSLGKKFNVRGMDSRTATGRGDVAQDVLAQTIVSYQNAIIRAEKNRIAKKVLTFLEDNYDPDFVSIEQKQQLKIIDENGKESYQTEVGLMQDPSVFFARVNGKPIEMKFNFTDKGSFAQSINGFVYPPKQNPLEYAVASVTKFTGRLLTTWNPFWVPVNFIRDIQTVYSNLDIDLGEGAGEEAMSSLVVAMRVSVYARLDSYNPNPQNKTRVATKKLLMKLLRDFRIGKKSDFDEMYDIYKEGRKAGGFTSFLNREGMDEQIDRIGNLLGYMNEKGRFVRGVNEVKKLGRGMSAFLEFLTIPMEVAPRLSAYKVARRRGLSQDKSANLSGEISVNFNMRGSVSLFRSAYLFFNPALQGTAKMMKMAVTNPQRFSKISAFWIMLGLTSNFLARMFGGGDEEGDDLDKLPHYQRSTKFILVPNVEGGALPIAYGWNAFYSAGHFLLDPLMGNATWGQTTKNILASTFEAFSPVAQGAGDAESFSGFLNKVVSPTVLQPSVEYAINENRFGTPIYKDRSFGQNTISETQMAFRNVNPVVEKAMIRLQEMTNVDGNVFNTEGVDINPALIEHFIRNHFGGIPNEGYQLWARYEREKLGVNLTEDQSYFARKFGAFVPERRHVGEYLKLRNKILTLADEADKLPDEALALGNPDRRNRIYEKYPDLDDMVDIIKDVDAELKELNKEYNEIAEEANIERLRSGKRDPYLEALKIEELNNINELKKEEYGYAVHRFILNGYKEGVRPRQ